MKAIGYVEVCLAMVMALAVISYPATAHEMNRDALWLADAAQDTAPVDTPEAPVDTPEAPVDTPEAPVDTPEAPVDTYEAPVEAVKPQELGEWWWRNSLTYEPRIEQLLHRIEVKYGYMRETGNFTRETHNIGGLGVIRKDRYTAYLQYSLTKETLPSYSRKIQNIHGSLRADLTAKLYAQGGALWTQDDDRFIKDRYTYYLGAGYDVLTTAQFLFTIFASAGYEELEYKDGLTKEGLPYQSQENVLYYLEQKFSWLITQNISFNEKFELIGSVEDSADYRWTLNFGLDFKINPYLALRLDYEQKYFNDTPDYVEKRDQKKGMFIKISF